MNNTATITAAAKSEDLQNLLHHIAWTDVISPELKNLKEEYMSVLTAAVLGREFTMGGAPITKEQLAGRIEGISFIHELFARILKEGRIAIEKCKRQNLNLVPEQK
jgi:hypothetical protein